MCGVDITARFTWQPGDVGTLVAHGDQSGGYALYVLDGGRPVLRHNDGRGGMVHLAGPPLEAGEHEVGARFEAIEGNRWRLHLVVDGTTVDGGPEVPMLYGMAPFEGITVGRDPRSPVSWDLYEQHGSFPYTGGLRSVTYTPGDASPGQPEDVVGLLRQLGAKFD
jgi:arylsulfatase